MSALVLDAGALSALARGGPHERTVRAVVAAALVEVADVVVPAAALGELYRAAAARRSADHVDATVLAVCAAAGGGVVLSSDPDDLMVLSGGSPAIVQGLGRP